MADGEGAAPDAAAVADGAPEAAGLDNFEQAIAGTEDFAELAADDGEAVSEELEAAADEAEGEGELDAETEPDVEPDTDDEADEAPEPIHGLEPDVILDAIREGKIPVVAVYSTFLQRAYDQIVHDVCLQNLPVVFSVDRSGEHPLTGRERVAHVSRRRHTHGVTGPVATVPARPVFDHAMIAPAIVLAGPVGLSVGPPSGITGGVGGGLATFGGITPDSMVDA